MSAAPILRCEALSVGYRRRRRDLPVLPPVTASVAAGTLVTLLGPNGTGKSTLLRTVAGLQRALCGSIEIEGRPLRHYHATDLARVVGVVLSEPVAVGALSGRQMVGLGRYAHTGWNGRLRQSDEAAIDRALASAGAAHLADRDCRELSDGERQRLNLARVLAQEPTLIVLDEPTAYLDVSARRELMILLHRLTRERSISVVASTHDLDLALRHADTVWLIDRSGMLQSGTPEDLVVDGAVAASFGDTDRSTTASIDSDTPTVAIDGPPRSISLGENVMTRAGYRTAREGEAAAVSIAFGPDGRRWNATLADGEVSGTSFAALAQLAERLHEESERVPLAPRRPDQDSRKRGSL